MSALVEGAKRLVGSGSDVADRIDGLAEAARSARGRLDDELVDEAAAVAERAGDRLRLSGDHTVVALAGATGLRASPRRSTPSPVSSSPRSAYAVRPRPGRWRAPGAPTGRPSCSTGSASPSGTR